MSWGLSNCVWLTLMSESRQVEISLFFSWLQSSIAFSGFSAVEIIARSETASMQLGIYSELFDKQYS